MPPPGSLERVLARDRLFIAAALAVLVALAWAYLVLLARRMGNGADVAAMASMPDMPGMPGMGGPVADEPAARAFALTAIMWWTMMVGMMLPSAAPMVLLFGTVQTASARGREPVAARRHVHARLRRRRGARSACSRRAAGVLAEPRCWRAMDPVTPARRRVARRARGRLPVTPLKNVCLRRCRSPAEFLSSTCARARRARCAWASSTASTASAAVGCSWASCS